MLNNTTLEELKRIALFRELNENELRHLAGDLEELEYKKGESIYQEGEIPGLLYIIQRGAVEITKKTPTGHRQVIARKEAGHFFGELSFFEKRRHAARAKALEDTRLILLNKFVYDELEKEQPLLVHKLLREIILTVSANLDSMDDMFLQMIHYAFYGGKAGKIEMPGGEED
ncbi:MAG TPA: cyclic nucleotide-binding domain-containing protein [Nitrospiria bacterium]|nr:cyclic nucleotide-binding domain-containing protein [Nitrospiria bacterium]